MFSLVYYHNPSLGLAMKVKGLQGCKPKGSPGATSHAPGSVRKCEGMHLHIPKTTPTWEMESQWPPESLGAISWVKTQWFEAFFILLERSWNINVRNGLALLIWTFKTQVMAKRKARSQIGNFSPDH
jgi:hypothetical protein